MSNYVWGTSLSHADYLQVKSFVSDVKSSTRDAAKKVTMDISRQTRDVIASNESLHREHIELLTASTDRTVGALNDGFERISYSMDAGFDRLSDGISELNATFHWGFGAVLASIGHINDMLSELVKIAKTPVQTAAFNHFEIARNAFHQGRYRESLEELDRAISGDHTSAGYKREWRFHQLKGILQLGFADCDTSLYDLAKAEESFLTAARYGKTDYPHDAGLAFLSAGWAAYCQGKMKEALAHTKKAKILHPAMGEGFFQASKIQMALGDVESALPMLAKAIDRDSFYALKAAGDGDFQPYNEKLRGFVEALRKEKYSQSVQKVKAVLDKLTKFELAPDVADNNELRLMRAFLSEGANWPLLDMLNVVHNLDNTRDVFLDSFKSLPIVMRIKAPCRSFDDRETYTEQESYYEDVVVKPGGFFKKSVTEKQQKTRMVTKTRSVTKSSSVIEILFEFCPVSAGSFMMGTNEKDFYLGRYPVTQQQWEAVMGNNPSHFKGERLPVETVSYDDCHTFIKTLNTLSSKQLYRLPTEDEWEYACRAGSISPYYFGDDQTRLGEYAWYNSNSAGKIHPVGQKKPNEWGLYDMAGNVWEWCSASVSPGRVLRGGSWRMGAGDCRSAILLFPPSNYCQKDVGFRLAFVP